MDTFGNAILDFISSFDDFLYTYILVVLLVAVGLYFSFRTRFVQIRYIKEMFTSLAGKSEKDDAAYTLSEDSIAEDAEKKEGAVKAPGQEPLSKEAYNEGAGKDEKKPVSSFAALMLSTASRVGTGNIVGIATAVAMGGPGAVFWMWAMALIGSASAFVESTLAQIWKVKNPDGTFRGGPAYYIQLALGSRLFGIVFAISLILCFGLGFNGLQAYNLTSALQYYIADGYKQMAGVIIGLLVVAATAFVIFGGQKRVSFMSSWIVPVMAIGYILIAIWTCVSNISDVPAVFGLIFTDAFDASSFAGGFAGSVIMWGVKRGLFSNEAGMGSAPNAAATADVSHPVKQGLVQTLSVYLDTILICTASALMVLIFYVQHPDVVAQLIASDSFNGIDFVQLAMANAVGDFGIHFMTIAIVLFAYSSLISNYLYAEGNILFIKDNKTLLFWFRMFCLAAIFYGSVNNFTLAWDLADIFMGIMAIINLISIVLLGKWALLALKDYSKQRRAGLDPVFYADSVPGLPKTEWWIRNPVLSPMRPSEEKRPEVA